MAEREATPNESEAETEIMGSKRNTPMKHTVSTSMDSRGSKEDGETSRGVRGAPPPPLHIPVASMFSASGKRKADVGGRNEDARSPTKRGESQMSPTKKARLSPEPSRAQRVSRVKSEEDMTAHGSLQEGDGVSRRRLRRGPKRASIEIKDEDSPAREPNAHSRSPSEQSASHRASTHEPRLRSESPTNSLLHKRSSSFQSSSNPAERERRLRQRRSKQTERTDSAELQSPSTTTHHLGMPGRKDIDRSGRTPLARACDRIDVADVKAILHINKEDINLKDSAGNSPIQFAALHGSTEIVSELVAAGADIHISNDLGDTPLIDAIENGHIKVIEQLLKLGVNPLQRNNKRRFPKDLIPQENERAAATITDLLDKAIENAQTAGTFSTQSLANARTRANLPGGKALHFTEFTLKNLRNFSEDGDFAYVGEILEGGVKPDNHCAVNAARNGHHEVLSLLLGFGAQADPSAPDLLARAETPMLAAIGRGNLEVIKLLLAQPKFVASRLTLDDKSYHDIAEKRKGPDWQKEAKILRKAFKAEKSRLRRGKDRMQTSLMLTCLGRKDLSPSPSSESSMPESKRESFVRQHYPLTLPAATPALIASNLLPTLTQEDENGVNGEEMAHDKTLVDGEVDEVDEADTEMQDVADEEDTEMQDAIVHEPEEAEAEPEPPVETREEYLAKLPRSLARMTIPGNEIAPTLPGRPWKKLSQWASVELFPRSEIDPSTADTAEGNQLYVANPWAMVYLRHARLDTGVLELDWKTLPMTKTHRETLLNCLAWGIKLAEDHNWYKATTAQLDEEGIDYEMQSCGYPSVSYASRILQACDKFMNLPDNQALWIREEDFVRELHPSKSPWLEGIRVPFTMIYHLRAPYTDLRSGSGSHAYVNGVRA